MNETLFLFLFLLVFPLVAILIRSLIKNEKKHVSSKSVLIALEELRELLPKTHIVDEEEVHFISDITHFLNKKEKIGVVHFYDGTYCKVDNIKYDKYISNDFIHLKDTSWINAYWIKKIKTEGLELLNGVQISNSNQL